MGYSCTALAALTMDAIGEMLDEKSARSGSNVLPGGGFYERGREQPDGAITGTVYKPYAPDPTKVVRGGSFKIAANGKAERFAGLSKAFLADATARGADKYLARYQPFEGLGSYRDALATAIDYGLPNEQAWAMLQTFAGEYQRQNRISFLVMPNLDPAAMVAWLGEIEI